ncbi:hypothetical protein [Cronobacter turicensis]|uniref:hypothetical protein n=1 Tax=Cronobacter turicensis TaxID=413502 RepID=UPI0024AFD35A|nr:hypothetical protein [Cronobacter turicensis]MDI7416005.1 hypothetical protein [Cronobacter turicensis]MDI7495930.1 hypothetical protein [Cronobacter turicensis]
MKGRIKSRLTALAALLALALSGQSSWAAQNNAAAQGNDFLSSIQQIEVKQIDFPAPTRRAQTSSASRAQINDLQQEIARLKKQLKAAEQEKKSLSAPGDLQAQNAQLLKDNSALAKENDRLSRNLQSAQREQGATSTQQAARIEVLEQKTAELQAALASKTTELAQLKKASASHSTSESTLQKQIARLETEKAAIAERNAQDSARVNRDMQALRNELNKRADELVALKTTGDKRAQSESALQKQLAQLEQEKATLTAQNEKSVGALNNKAQTLQAELDKRTAELAALKKAGAEHTQSQSTLEKQLAQLEQEKATLTAQNAKNVSALNSKAQALQAELDKRAAELAALKKAGAEHTQSQSALEKQLAQLQQEKATLTAQNEKNVSALNSKAQALQAELDKRAAELTALKKAGTEHTQSQSALEKQLAQLQQEKATLTAQNEKSVDALNKQLAQLEQEKTALAAQNSMLLKTSTLSNEEKEKLQKAQAEQTALLQKNQAAEAALKAQIATLTEKLNASTTLAASTQEKATSLATELASVKGSQSDKEKALQSQLQQAAQLAAAKETLNKQLTAAQTDIATLKQALADKESRLQQSDNALASLKEESQSVKALSTASAASQQKAQAELEALKRANEELNGKLASLNADSAAQKAQAEKEKADLLAQTEKLKADAAAQTQAQTASKTAPEVSAATLKDKANKQSYANGVMFSRLVQKSMDQMADLGIKTNLPILLAGIKDGLAQKVAIEPKALLSLHESMLKELSSREEKKYQAGIDKLEKATAQKKLLKRNKSLFFVQTKAGKKAIAPGETINVTFKEQTIEGRVLNNNANVPVLYDENLPYIFQQALELGKRGGIMEVYCFAGDLYNPDTMPPDLFNYSLMKLTVTISAGK